VLNAIVSNQPVWCPHGITGPEGPRDARLTARITICLIQHAQLLLQALLKFFICVPGTIPSQTAIIWR